MASGQPETKTAGRHEGAARRLEESVFRSPGETDPGLRRRVGERAAALSSGRRHPDLSSELAPFVDKVALHAYKVVDGDVERLRNLGYSEDAIFELAVSAAVGAGLERFERGFAALGAASGT